MTTCAEGTLGNRLKEARVAGDISVEKAAAAVGVQPETISDYELGVQDPGATTLLALADLYGAPAGRILTGRDYIVRHNFSGQEVAMAVLSASPGVVLLVNQEAVSDEALFYIWESIEFNLAVARRRREFDERE